MKRGQTGEIFAKHMSGSRLLSRIYKEPSKHNKSKQANFFLNWEKDFNRHFNKEDMWMTTKHMKTGSTSLAIKKMQIKTITRYHYTPIRIAKIKNNDNTKRWQTCR